MWATSLRMRDQGTRISLLEARAALRMVVRKSARGSVCIEKWVTTGLPTGFRHDGDLAAQGQFAEGDAAEAELAHVGAAAARELAAVVGAGREFRFALLFDDPGGLGHRVFFYEVGFSLRSEKGMPKRARSSLASSFLRAVVTMVMSMPRLRLTLSSSTSGKMVWS